MDRRLKIIFIILLIILLSIISFVGLFVQDTKFMNNLLPDYQLGMDLEGYRAATIVVSDETETIYYDADGNQVDTETEDGSSEEVPVNSEDILTTENYEKTKQIIEDRLEDLSISEYLIRFNEDNGSMTVELPENTMTDAAVQFLYTKGDFTIEDENGQVLLDNSNLKEAQVGYSNTGTSGTTVYLSFIFNDDSAEKLQEITNTYVTTTNEDGEEESKEVSINIDGSALLTTSFDEEISDGRLPLTLGTATDNDTLSEYIDQASNIAVLLNNGELPIEYTVEQNRFIKSDIELNDMLIPGIIIGVILVIAFIALLVKYKKLGLLGIISFIGYIAVLLIIIRYTNVVITMEGIMGLLISAILNYILLVCVLQNLKKKDKNKVEYKNAFNKSMLSMILVLIPTIIIGIVLCFATWLPIYSFGTVLFWGILIMLVYNEIFTRIMFLNSIKE